MCSQNDQIVIKYYYAKSGDVITSTQIALRIFVSININKEAYFMEKKKFDLKNLSDKDLDNMSKEERDELVDQLFKEMRVHLRMVKRYT